MAEVINYRAFDRKLFVREKNEKLGRKKRKKRAHMFYRICFAENRAFHESYIATVPRVFHWTKVTARAPMACANRASAVTKWVQRAIFAVAV